MNKAMTALALVTKLPQSREVQLRDFQTPEGRNRLGVYTDPGNDFVGIVSVIYDQTVREVLRNEGVRCQLVSLFDGRGQLVLTFN